MRLIMAGVLLSLGLLGCAQTPEQAGEGDKASQNTLTGQWQLVELMGHPIKAEKAPNLEFNEEGRVSGFAGCNRFFGDVEVKGLSIHFGQLGATMMACPDMQIESKFMQVLEKADNYSLGNDSLSLNKARMAPLARFERVKAD